MPPGLRRFALAVHLTCSVGWIGAIVAYLVLDLIVATSEDARLVRGAWMAMDRIAAIAIVPLAAASLLTGLIMALGTKWGLFRHWWVIVSLVLTTGAAVVLLGETRVIARAAAIAADPMTSDTVLLTLPPTLVHSVGGLVVLLLVQILNVYKPQGLTPYGWRKQHQERRHRQLGAAPVR